jgi:hypothetical protein
MDENRNEIEGNQVVKFVLNFHGLGLLEQFGVTIRGIRILIWPSGTGFTLYFIEMSILLPLMSIQQLPKVLLLVFRMTSKGTHFMVM